MLRLPNWTPVGLLLLLGVIGVLEHLAAGLGVPSIPRAARRGDPDFGHGYGIAW